MSEPKKITVAVKTTAAMSEVANRLKEAGATDIAQLKFILTITASWKGSVEEVKKIKGVDHVEVQKQKYFPS